MESGIGTAYYLRRQSCISSEMTARLATASRGTRMWFYRKRVMSHRLVQIGRLCGVGALDEHTAITPADHHTAAPAAHAGYRLAASARGAARGAGGPDAHRPVEYGSYGRWPAAPWATAWQSEAE